MTVTRLLTAKFAVLALCWTGLLFAGQVQAECQGLDDAVEPAALSPYQRIEVVTSDILTQIDHHRKALEGSTEESVKQQQFVCFITQVNSILGDVVDFDWIALKVMGGYGKVATDEQRQQFAEAFRSGLVDTYGRGLLGYSSQKIVLLPGDDVGDKRKVTVRQQIEADDGVYPLSYTMGLKDGEWKVINVVINGINLGKIFRKQFAQASEKSEGDIDEVIAGWDSGINNG